MAVGAHVGPVNWTVKVFAAFWTRYVAVVPAGLTKIIAHVFVIRECAIAMLALKILLRKATLAPVLSPRSFFQLTIFPFRVALMAPIIPLVIAVRAVRTVAAV